MRPRAAAFLACFAGILFLSCDWLEPEPPDYPHRPGESVSLGAFTQAVCARPDGEFVYVANSPQDLVHIVRAFDFVHLEDIPVDPGPRDLVCSPDGRYLYVACSDSEVVDVVDLSYGNVMGPIAMPDNPTCITVLPDGSRIYVGLGYPTNAIAVIDFDSFELIDTIPTEDSPRGIVCVNNDWAYAWTGSGILAIRTSDHSIVHTYPCPYVQGFCLLPDGSSIYYSNRFEHSVVCLSAPELVEHEQVRLQGRPTALFALPGGEYVYAGDDVEGWIHIIRTEDNTPVYRVGRVPRAVDFASGPEAERVYLIYQHGTGLASLVR